MIEHMRHFHTHRLCCITTLPIVALSALFFCAQQSALADAFGLRSAAQAEQYGINYPGQTEMPGASLTPTSHHRFGSQTGIGSSTLQTEANTAEAMPRVQYTPTANAPLAVTGGSTRSWEVPKFHLFSQRMLSLPTVTPQLTSSPNLNQMMSPGMPSLSSGMFGSTGLSTSSSLDMPILQRHVRGHSATQLDLLQMDNPLEHL